MLCKSVMAKAINGHSMSKSVMTMAIVAIMWRRHWVKPIV